MLSFDRYPLLASGEDAQYFHNWAIIRSEGLRANIPTWTFVQSVEYNNHRFPTQAELLWQINTTWLSQVGVELKPLVSELAVHANETPPAGATGFTADTTSPAPREVP